MEKGLSMTLHIYSDKTMSRVSGKPFSIELTASDCQWLISNLCTVKIITVQLFSLLIVSLLPWTRGPLPGACNFNTASVNRRFQK